MRFTRGFTYLAAASLAAGTMLAVTVPHALAAADKDNLSPASTAVTGTATNFQAKGVIDGFPITVNCTSSTLKAKTPAHGLGPVTVKAAFTGCTDGLNGTDKVKTFGVWKLSFIDAANDEGGEAAGDKLSVTIPKGGATFVSSALPTCKVTVAPTAPFTFTSAYDDVNTATVSVNLPTGGTGCSTSATAHTTATYTLNINMHDVS